MNTLLYMYSHSYTSSLKYVEFGHPSVKLWQLYPSTSAGRRKRHTPLKKDNMNVYLKMQETSLFYSQNVLLNFHIFLYFIVSWLYDLMLIFFCSITDLSEHVFLAVCSRILIVPWGFHLEDRCNLYFRYI